MSLFSSKIEHLRALTEVDGYANDALLGEKLRVW